MIGIANRWGEWETTIRPDPKSKIRFICSWIGFGWSVEVDFKHNYKDYHDSGWLGCRTHPEDGLQLCWRYLGAL